MTHATLPVLPQAEDGRGNPLPAFIRFRLYLGHEIKAERRTFPGETVDVEQATALVAREFPQGFTVYDARGRWVGPDGRIVSEPTTVFEILSPNETGLEMHRVRMLAESLARVFRQDAVMLSAEPLPVLDFVAAG